MKPQFAQKYGDFEQWHWWFRARQRILEALIRRAYNGQRNLSIVTVGCGPAAGLAWLVSLAGPQGRVVGLDSDPSHATELPPGADYVVGKLEERPLAGSAFDLVLALDVLEHLDDDAAGLREAVRLIKPGGMLILTVPALPSLWGKQDEVSHHRRRYTRRMLYDTFERAALSRPAVSYFNTFLLPPIAAIRWLRRLQGGSQATRSDFEDNHPGPVNQVLTAIFSAERHLIQRIPLPLGVSLLATLRR